MSVKHIFNTDTNAPQLSGQAGALIALLDGFLVDGYVGHTPPGGWVKAFSGTNKAVYRSTFAGASGMYFRVEDSTTTYATLTGYESMTDVDTGTNAFATLYWRKSNAADATTRPYCIAADERTVIFAPIWTNTTFGSVNLFGDFISHIPGDGYNALLTGDSTSSGASPTSVNLSYTCVALNSTQAGQYIARPYTFAPGGVAFGKSQFGTATGHVGIANPVTTMPDQGNGDYYSSPLLMSEVGCCRGKLPGLHAPMHYVAETLFATHDAVVDGVSRSFHAITVNTSGGYRYWLDATGPWQ